ncbi:MAG: HAMP domain-containing histidine kinase [Chloroflexota bacterium]|nr:HAMP domain-containing histidine kinase [Chloroflexota bacterium]
MSLRLRLTLWYTGILAATLLFVFLISYFALQFALNQQTEQILAARERQYSVALLRLVEGSGDPREAFRSRLSASVLFGANPDVYAQLVYRDGTPLAADLPQGLPVSREIIGRVTRTGHPATQIVRVGEAVLHVENFPLVDNGQVIAVVQLGRDVTQTEATLGFLRQVLIFAGIVGLLVAFVSGWLLSRKALTPIKRIAQTAYDIGASQDFSRRVEYNGSNDELGRLTATFNDMLEKIEAAYRQIESSLAAQRRFVADASHELRTPLTTIRGNIGLLTRGQRVSSEDSREALQDMASEAERMSRLVSNLLTLARADAGLHFAKGTVRLDDLMKDVYRQTRVLSNGVTLLAGELEPASVTGSPDFLKQLLLILVENALKNTPSGGMVELASASEDGWVKVWVRDTGKGIPAEAVPHIFERFYQADNSRSGGGTGLGLAIAKWIVDEHGGRIAVDSKVGQGSTFTVWLPCRVRDTESCDAGWLAG